MADYKVQMDEKYANMKGLRIESELSAFSKNDESPTKLPDIAGGRNQGNTSELKT